jgi:hypothetical protein
LCTPSNLPPLPHFELLLEEIEQQPSLFLPHSFPQRSEALHRLETLLEGENPTPQAFIPRAEALAARLDAANLDLYRSIHREILSGHKPQLLQQLVNPPKPEPQSDFAPSGLSFDYLDDLIAGILQLEEPSAGHQHPGGEMVFYQPTPARHIFHLLAETALGADDILLDLGSGLGHVPLMAAICTTARAIGIEREPAYVQCARQCAAELGLTNAAFIEADVRDADLSRGTVFYLYTPFTGGMLASVLQLLRDEAQHRPIRIATFGPCTLAAAEETWLEAVSTPQPSRVTLFQARE